MRGSPWFILAAFLAASLAWGCSASFDGTTYRGADFAFRVPPPPSSWTRLQADGANLVFRDEGSGSTIAISARCGKDGDDVSLSSLTQHLFLRFTEREIQLEETVPFDRREAMHTVLSAKLDGVPKKFDVWVMKKDGCVYDLDFISEPSRFDAGVIEFRKLAAGFATVPLHE